jgi:hypothetical protein
MTPMISTYSMWSLFRNCRKAVDWRYLQHLVPLQRDRNLHFGSTIHECLQAWHERRELDEVLALINRLCANRLQDENQRRDWHLAAAMMRGYAARYTTDDFEIIALEKAFEGPIVNPATGAASRSFVLAGKVDGIVRIGGEYFILEHKTAGQLDGDYLEKLWTDFQITLYAHYIEQTMGIPITAGRLRTPEGALVNFAGKVFAKPNDPVRLEGQWTHHPKYGRQFAVEALGYDLEMEPDGLANFLANHPDVKGIGPAKARLIADHFGAGFDAAIRTRPETVAAIAKVPLESILVLQKIWIANSDFNAAMTYLSRFGLTHHQVTTLVERFGSQVVPILERDPYVLMREITGFGFKRVDKIARKMGTPKDLPSRIRAGIQYCVLDALDDGDCWVEYEDLLDRANTLLVMDTLDSREVIERHLEGMIAEGQLISQPFERLVVADPEIQRIERELADVLATAHTRSPHAVNDLEGLLDAEGALLNREQREAVKNALTYSISLMTGGAGSGKTYAVSTITTIADRLEKRVVLAAPTGKAAKRLEQVVRHDASTIHRLLGFNGHTYFRHHRSDVCVRCNAPPRSPSKPPPPATRNATPRVWTC